MELEENPDRISSRSKVLLLDVEGTTTPISFVYDGLFPYAREQLGDFLERSFREPEVAAAVELLAAEHARDVEAGAEPPAWADSASAVAAYCESLMNSDRKATGLKAIQGLIWKDGYENGALKAPLYDDVVPAFERWTGRGARIFIYSSGSVLAQKLLFSHSDRGDVTPFLSGYFDTTTGKKNESESYEKIARAVRCAPGEVCFLSDSLAEINAAGEAEMVTGVVMRESEPPLEHREGHIAISGFDSVE